MTRTDCGPDSTLTSCPARKAGCATPSGSGDGTYGAIIWWPTSNPTTGIARSPPGTQNVDDLHERAGSGAVHHLHGSLFEFRCARCGVPYTDALPEMPEPAIEVEPPVCDCGGLIRPDIVWFGEPLPEEPWRSAVEATGSADVMVVVGTSAIVYPAAGLPDLALARGTAVIEVNPEPTPLSGSATISIRESASQALPGLLERLPALLK